METTIASWLIEQVPVVVILGVVAYLLYKDNRNLRDQLNQLQDTRHTDLKEMLSESFAGTQALEKLSDTIDKLVDRMRLGG